MFVRTTHIRAVLEPLNQRRCDVPTPLLVQEGERRIFGLANSGQTLWFARPMNQGHSLNAADWYAKFQAAARENRFVYLTGQYQETAPFPVRLEHAPVVH